MPIQLQLYLVELLYEQRERARERGTLIANLIAIEFDLDHPLLQVNINL